jgi:CheY-like chemotaxis protein
MLDSLGCEAVAAGTCTEAMARLTEERFDVVLLDILMENAGSDIGPDGQKMNGLDVCRWIRAASPQPNVPVCIITADLDHNAAIEAFQIGASGYIVKPFDLQELQAKLNELVGE